MSTTPNKKEEKKKEINIPDPGDALEKCQAERDEYLAGWQRAKADFMNYRKQEEERFASALQYAQEDFVRELITVIDNFDLGLRALEKQGPVERGIYMIRTQIEDALRKRGLEKLILSPGDPFDPGIAESVGEKDSKHPPGTVDEMIEPGYRLRGKVLRPVRVMLSRDKESQENKQ